MFKTVILGNNVTKNAKSPKIWNKISELFQINSQMIAIDADESNFENILSNLQKDKYFIGGLLGSPLKSHTFLDKFDKSTKSQLASAVNCIFLDNNIWKCTTFDGEAAIASINANVKVKDFENIFVLGSGPVARSIYTELLDNGFADKRNIYIISRRSVNKSTQPLILYEDYQFLEKKLKLKNLIINATPLGSPLNNTSPLNYSSFLKIGKESFYFDSNYGDQLPLACRISQQLGIQFVDGAEMNLVQAIKGFIKVHRCANINLIFNDALSSLAGEFMLSSTKYRN
jgi:shikimate 5-dehydrogenase